MAALIDWSKADKFSGDQKYFNLSILWIFYYRFVIRMFYHLGVHPYFVLFLSVLSGIISALFLWFDRLILAAIFLHLKDVFDASDGSLARLTGRTSRIGRFLDSLGDMGILTIVILVTTAKALAVTGRNYYIGLGALTWISLFIQCSYFNYYQLSYAVSLKTSNLNSRIDESKSEPREYEDDPLLKLLHGIYCLTYGWQDRLVKNIDKLSCSIIDIYSNFSQDSWYRSKLFLTFNSALCFGTHIFVFIICFIFGNPGLALWIISIIFNAYLLIVMTGRIMYFKIKLAKSTPKEYIG